MSLDVPMMVFIAGLVIASVLALQARSKEGEEGTRAMLDSGLVNVIFNSK